MSDPYNDLQILRTTYCSLFAALIENIVNTCHRDGTMNQTALDLAKEQLARYTAEENTLREKFFSQVSK